MGARPSADLRRSADGRPSAGLRPVGLRLSLFHPSLLSGRAPGALSKRLDELSALVLTAIVSGLPGFAVLKLEYAGLVPGRLDDLGPPLPAAGFSDRAALRATARSASGDNFRSPPSRLWAKGCLRNLRTDSMVFGRGLGTSKMGQPSYPKAFRISPDRYFMYGELNNSSRFTKSKKVGGACRT